MIANVGDGLEVMAAAVAVWLIIAVFGAALFHLLDLLDDDEFPEDPK